MKKQHLFPVLILAALIATLSVSCKKEEKRSLNIEINIPADWTKVEFWSDQVIFVGFSPLEDENDEFQEFFTVEKEQVTYSTLGEYVAVNTTQLSGLDGYMYESQIDTTINGQPCTRLIFSATLYGYDEFNNPITITGKFMHYTFLMNGYGYVVLFQATEESFDAYRDEFDGIMDSFIIK